MTDPTKDDNLLLHALADDELDAGTALILERRMKAEPALAAEYERILALKSAVGRATRPEVSADFQARIAALAAKPAAATQPATGRRPFTFDPRAIAASLVLVAALSSASTYWITASRDTSIEDAVMAGHRRSLLAASPIDVASSDRHTVRPWFDTKLGLAPPTPDLAGAGFPLVGGRVDIVGGKPVPTLVYKRGPHLITVSALPLAAGDKSTSAPAASASEGYNTARWKQDGFSYWAVSDLDASQLAAFVGTLRAKSKL